MHFSTKSYLKNTRNHIPKHSLSIPIQRCLYPFVNFQYNFIILKSLWSMLANCFKEKKYKKLFTSELNPSTKEALIMVASTLTTQSTTVFATL